MIQTNFQKSIVRNATLIYGRINEKRPLNILIVDDTFINLITTEILIKRDNPNHFILKINEGKAAIDIFKEYNRPNSRNRLHIVLVDYFMP